MLLYDDLVSWYDLVDPVADHEDEAAVYLAALLRSADGEVTTMLELGAGAGNNAWHMKRRLRCTLTDVSEPMLALSRAQNPECEHVAGDMRTLRLRRTFDVVLVHDAVMYMTTEDDLRAAAQTAWEHTRAGGAAVFAPDHLRETFAESSALMQSEAGGRAMRGVDWTWDPDPTDTTYVVDYAFLLRDEDGVVKAVHDRHVEGLFPRATWAEILEGVGWRVAAEPTDLGDGITGTMFVCRKPV